MLLKRSESAMKALRGRRYAMQHGLCWHLVQTLLTSIT
jgi:hypothetical protein